jgi:large subunit ribosomal protein L29
MKAQNIRELTEDELQHQYDETVQELFNLKMQKSFGQLENPARLRILRRDVARLETILDQRRKAEA